MSSAVCHRHELALLAKELAGNEQVIRDRALRKLGKLFSGSNLISGNCLIIYFYCSQVLSEI